MNVDKENQEEQKLLQEFLTEEELKGFLGLTDPQLARLRNTQRLPFLKIQQNKRLYLVKDITDWLIDRRTVLNEHTD